MFRVNFVLEKSDQREFKTSSTIISIIVVARLSIRLKDTNFPECYFSTTGLERFKLHVQ